MRYSPDNPNSGQGGKIQEASNTLAANTLEKAVQAVIAARPVETKPSETELQQWTSAMNKLTNDAARADEKTRQKAFAALDESI